MNTECECCKATPAESLSAWMVKMVEIQQQNLPLLQNSASFNNEATLESSMVNVLESKFTERELASMWHLFQ